jgi:hypothetical protein
VVATLYRVKLLNTPCIYCDSLVAVWGVDKVPNIRYHRPYDDTLYEFRILAPLSWFKEQVDLPVILPPCKAHPSFG